MAILFNNINAAEDSLASIPNNAGFVSGSGGITLNTSGLGRLVITDVTFRFYTTGAGFHDVRSGLVESGSLRGESPRIEATYGAEGHYDLKFTYEFGGIMFNNPGSSLEVFPGVRRYSGSTGDLALSLDASGRPRVIIEGYSVPPEEDVEEINKVSFNVRSIISTLTDSTVRCVVYDLANLQEIGRSDVFLISDKIGTSFSWVAFDLIALSLPEEPRLLFAGLETVKSAGDSWALQYQTATRNNYFNGLVYHSSTEPYVTNLSSFSSNIGIQLLKDSTIIQGQTNLLGGSVNYFDTTRVMGQGFNYVPTDTHSKPTNPTPANESEGASWATPQLSWEGNGETYTVWVSDSNIFFDQDKVAENIGTTSYTLTSQQKERFLDISGPLYWRVNSTEGEEELTGDTWQFDPRPGAPTSPTPTDGAGDQGLSVGLEWATTANSTNWDVEITHEWTLEITRLLSSSTDLTYGWDFDYLMSGRTYSWRVIAHNEYGTYTGPWWTFTIEPFITITTTYNILPDLGLPGYTGNGPYAEEYPELPPGVPGLDFKWSGRNMIAHAKRLVVAARNRIFYEV